MEFFFPDADPDLQRLPPDQTRILELRADPYPDGERVHVILDITPFEQRPHIELLLTDAQDREVAAASLIEPMAWKLELTLHLRPANPGRHTLRADLFYLDGPRAEPVETTFEIPVKD